MILVKITSKSRMLHKLLKNNELPEWLQSMGMVLKDQPLAKNEEVVIKLKRIS